MLKIAGGDYVMPVKDGDRSMAMTNEDFISSTRTLFSLDHAAFLSIERFWIQSAFLARRTGSESFGHFKMVVCIVWMATLTMHGPGLDYCKELGSWQHAFIILTMSLATWHRRLGSSKLPQKCFVVTQRYQRPVQSSALLRTYRVAILGPIQIALFLLHGMVS